MFCPHCGKDIGEQTTGYCPNCGKPVDSLSAADTKEETSMPKHQEEIQARKKKDNEEVLAVVSMALGILSIVCALGGFLVPFGGPIVGILFGILGIVFSRNRTEHKDFAKIGKICGIIGIVLSVIMFALTILAVAGIIYYSYGTSAY